MNMTTKPKSRTFMNIYRTIFSTPLVSLYNVDEKGQEEINPALLP